MRRYKIFCTRLSNFRFTHRFRWRSCFLVSVSVPADMGYWTGVKKCLFVKKTKKIKNDIDFIGAHIFRQYEPRGEIIKDVKSVLLAASCGRYTPSIKKLSFSELYKCDIEIPYTGRGKKIAKKKKRPHHALFGIYFRITVSIWILLLYYYDQPGSR